MKTTEDNTSNRVEGPTPHGGAYSIAYFLDELHKPCPKPDASFVRVIEYAKDGTEVASTMMKRKKK